MHQINFSPKALAGLIYMPLSNSIHKLTRIHKTKTMTISSDFSIKKTIFISNSMPKSGSTYLFSLQEELLKKAFGINLIHQRKIFASRSIKYTANYIHHPNQSEFIELLNDTRLDEGPYLFKTHCVVDGALRDAYINSKHVFFSCCVRDPVETFLSAHDNFIQTGEFSEFKTFDSGCEIINNYFSKIVCSCKDMPQSKAIPIIRYEDIVENPVSTLVDSLGPILQKPVLLKLVSNSISLEGASSSAKDRMNKGILNRAKTHKDQHLIDKLESALDQARRLVGY